MEYTISRLYKTLTRKGKDYTYLYGKHVGEGTLTPFIHGHAFHEDVEECVDLCEYSKN
jgi:DNA ligase 4